jgi:hypothetical protein
LVYILVDEDNNYIETVTDLSLGIIDCELSAKNINSTLIDWFELQKTIEKLTSSTQSNQPPEYLPQNNLKDFSKTSVDFKYFNIGIINDSCTYGL